MQPVTVILKKGKRKYVCVYSPDTSFMIVEGMGGGYARKLTNHEAILFISKSFQDLLNEIPLPEPKALEAKQ